MNKQELIESWKAEERQAQMHGWDFSHLDGRMQSGDDALPWELTEVLRRYLRPDDRLLDMDTGGGEFLLSLGHPHENTAATEGWPPNIALCRERLLPLGIEFRPMPDASAMPFDDAQFDVILNRHGSYDVRELRRVLRPGGFFVTQQVGRDNDRELVNLLLPGTPVPFPELTLSEQAARFKEAGFTLREQGEIYLPIRFYDVGALVWFARVIEWEFPGFSVDRCTEQLLNAEQICREQGYLEGRIHRFYLAAERSAIQ
ncbi:MAG: methyltransferase domain-containing protein [Oscillospiraceae bacterium]|nr:methyltransferase domain-containing protein [Oscillospiraceae bacterium]